MLPGCAGGRAPMEPALWRQDERYGVSTASGLVRVQRERSTPASSIVVATGVADGAGAQASSGRRSHRTGPVAMTWGFMGVCSDTADRSKGFKHAPPCRIWHSTTAKRRTPGVHPIGGSPSRRIRLHFCLRGGRVTIRVMYMHIPRPSSASHTPVDHYWLQLLIPSSTKSATVTGLPMKEAARTDAVATTMLTLPSELDRLIRRNTLI